MAPRIPPRKVTYFEPVPPHLARNTITKSTFEVGRFRCTMRVDCGQLDLGAVIRPIAANGSRACPSSSTKRSLPTGARAATRSISSPHWPSARASRSPTDKHEAIGARAGIVTALRSRHGAAGSGRRSATAALPEWIRPQLTELVDAAPEGEQWLHEIKFDGYRMHAWLDRGAVKLLTRTGLDWTHKYSSIAAAVSALGPHQG
jgi:hypothetical protein